jgi:hypothetical protein
MNSMITYACRFRRSDVRRPALLATLGLALVLSACVHGDIVVDASDSIVRTELVGSPASLVTLILPHLLYQRLRWQAGDRKP